MPADTRGPLCAVRAEKLHSGIQGSRDIPAFPAQWVDGLCRALPGDEFLFVTVASRIDDAANSVELTTPPRRLDRSNDGQDHTVLPYAEFA